MKKRDIKFKAFHRGEEEWYTLDLTDIAIMGQDNWLMYTHQRQYTGRIDRNELEIYEGDIIKHGESLRFVEARGSNYCATRGDKSATILLSFCELPEVIGNIYDNPDLLEN